MSTTEPMPIPGASDTRPARTVRMTYRVVLTPAEDRTLIAVMESKWVGGQPFPRHLGTFSVDAAERADWDLGGPAVMPQVLRAVAAYLEA